MKATLIIITVVVVLLLVWINSPQRPAHQDDTPSVEVAAIEASYRLQDVYNLGNLHLEKASAAYRYEDLQLYPVFASQTFVRHHQRLGPYRSLQEAMEKKQIVITELSDDGDPVADTVATYGSEDSDQAQVNKLFIENISSDTIIILGGEVVRGGKQDRMIAQDFMIMPHSGKIDVDVYCVEHGRWVPTEGEALSFSVAMDVAPNRVRKATKESAPQYPSHGGSVAKRRGLLLLPTGRVLLHYLRRSRIRRRGVMRGIEKVQSSLFHRPPARDASVGKAETRRREVAAEKCIGNSSS